jgi:hypothetical protein
MPCLVSPPHATHNSLLLLHLPFNKLWPPPLLLVLLLVRN